MANRTKEAGKPARNGSSTAFGSIRFSGANVILMAAGVAAIAAGYFLLARGSTVGAPLLLVLGYVALIPIAIMR